MRFTPIHRGLLQAAIVGTLITGCGAGTEESGTSGTGSTSTATNISIASATMSITEGKAGQKTTDDVVLRLSKVHNSEIVINYATEDKTAIAGERYQQTSGSVSFSPGEREKSIDVTVIGNDEHDEDSNFDVLFTLEKGDNTKLINAKATVVIKDDDPEPKINLEIQRADVREGVGVVDIYATLDRGSYKQVDATLDFAGLASKSNDYSINSTTISFEPYSKRSSTYITINEDEIIEGSETIEIALSKISNGSTGDKNTMTVLIQGDLKLNDTGVVSHYNNGNYDALVPDGEHPHQDADYGLDTNANYNSNNGYAGLFYNKIDFSGNSLPENASGHTCTYDAHTGLTWEIKGDYFYHEFLDKPSKEELDIELAITGDHYNNRNGRYRYYNANDKENGGSKGGVNSSELTSPVFAATGICMFPPREHPLSVNSVSTKGCSSDKYIEVINKSARCGYVDWRLPSITELQTLMIYEDDHRGFDQNYFPDTKASEASHTSSDFIFLSSTPSVDNDASVWCMDVATRRTKLCNKTEAHHVRLVRGNKF